MNWGHERPWPPKAVPLGDSPLHLGDSLQSFFFDQLEEAQDEDCSLPEEVEAYVVQMLACYARKPEVAGRTSAPLALQYLKAQERGPPALRHVGDRALYIAGVVPRSLDRGPVGVGYVAGIGRAAYSEVHARVGKLTVFAGLAQSFGTVVELLGRVCDSADRDPGDDLLALYERWRREGGSRNAQRLLAAGVLLDPERSDILQ